LLPRMMRTEAIVATDRVQIKKDLPPREARKS